jgi:hypothetical protein
MSSKPDRPDRPAIELFESIVGKGQCGAILMATMSVLDYHKSNIEVHDSDLSDDEMFCLIIAVKGVLGIIQCNMSPYKHNLPFLTIPLGTGMVEVIRLVSDFIANLN